MQSWCTASSRSEWCATLTARSAARRKVAKLFLKMKFENLRGRLQEPSVSPPHSPFDSPVCLLTTIADFPLFISGVCVYYLATFLFSRLPTYFGLLAERTMDPKQAAKSQQQYEASIEILKSLQVSIQAEQQRYQTFAARLSKIATPRTQYDSQLSENESVLQVNAHSFVHTIHVAPAPISSLSGSPTRYVDCLFTSGARASG